MEDLSFYPVESSLFWGLIQSVGQVSETRGNNTRQVSWRKNKHCTYNRELEIVD